MKATAARLRSRVIEISLHPFIQRAAGLLAIKPAAERGRSSSQGFDKGRNPAVVQLGFLRLYNGRSGRCGSAPLRSFFSGEPSSQGIDFLRLQLRAEGRHTVAAVRNLLRNLILAQLGADLLQIGGRPYLAFQIISMT